MAAPELRTDRLLLRHWRPSDRPAFAAMGADPEVMRTLGPLLTREQSDALADRIDEGLRHEPFGLWAVEVPGVLPFAGYVGLARPTFEAAFTPCVEVGWRLARSAWGHGYATEGARAALAHAFETVGLDEVVSFTIVWNDRSRAVMARLGMTHDPADDFDHPRVAPDDPMRPHVLYRITRERFRAAV